MKCLLTLGNKTIGDNMWDFNNQKAYQYHGFYIPQYMMHGLQRYIEYHLKPGDFLSAVIKNDLKAAVGHADGENLANIPAYVGFFYNEAPSTCWGSKEAFKNWLTIKPERRIIK